MVARDSSAERSTATVGRLTAGRRAWADRVVVCPVGSGRLWWLTALRAECVRPLSVIGASAQVRGVWADAL
jgi:hypothetical protein